MPRPASLALLAAVRTYWNFTGNDPGGNDGTREFLPVVGIILVATTVVFGLLVRTASVTNAPRRALGLAITGLLSIAVFWTGLPAVLAAGAASMGMSSRGPDARLGATSIVALAVVTTGLAIWLAVAG